MKFNPKYSTAAIVIALIVGVTAFVFACKYLDNLSDGPKYEYKESANVNLHSEQTSYSRLSKFVEPKTFTVISEELSTVGEKYQVLLTVSMDDKKVSNSTMQKVMYKIYHDELNKKVFGKITKPNAIAVYMYSSKEKAIKTKGEWNMMLWKNVDDKEPKLTLANNNTPSQQIDSEKEFTIIKRQFDNKGVDFCDFYYLVSDWMKEANKMDDEYYKKHSNSFEIGKNKADKWLDKKISVWLYKKHLPDSLGNLTVAYGPSFCK